MRFSGKLTKPVQEIPVRIIAEFIAVLLALCIRHRRKVILFLFSLGMSLFILALMSDFGKTRVPFPLLFIILGTIFVMRNWKL